MSASRSFSFGLRYGVRGCGEEAARQHDERCRTDGHALVARGHLECRRRVVDRDGKRNAFGPPASTTGEMPATVKLVTPPPGKLEKSTVPPGPNEPTRLPSTMTSNGREKPVGKSVIPVNDPVPSLS